VEILRSFFGVCKLEFEVWQYPSQITLQVSKAKTVKENSNAQNFIMRFTSRAVHMQRGQAEKTIFTIFRVSLLIILWIFGTFFGI
jgi:hypothetical protein